MSFGRLLLLCVVFAWGSAIAQAAFADDEATPRSPATGRISGREIFLREWLPNDPRSHGGDGLGPMFNETSCVACHNQGGVGGSGAESKNVNVISAVRVPDPKEQEKKTEQHAAAQASRINAFLVGETLAEQVSIAVAQAVEDGKKLAARSAKKSATGQERQQAIAALKRIHPGLAKARSVVLHRSSTEDAYEEWRQKLMLGTDVVDEISEVSGAINPPKSGEPAAWREFAWQVFVNGAEPREMSVEKFGSVSDALLSHPTFRGQFGAVCQTDESPQFAIQVTQRNTTALFGAGLIDSISDAVLIEAAQIEHPEYPQATGRIARLKDGKIGRFGWKSQKASLHDFTMTACAIELGLHVPDHPQAGSPHHPDDQPTGFDLNQDECLALVQYLKELPAPAPLMTDNAALRESLRGGERLFAKVGCAACHTPQLGEVAGIYSDLLLHDMGPESGDSGSYGVFVPDEIASDTEDPIPELTVGAMDGQSAPMVSSKTLQLIPDNLKGAGSQEWRTPPLWGVRDSAPYLHDGRAKTLEQAIAMHGGEGHQAALNFFHLSKRDQSLVLAFLRTLVAPDAIAAAK